MSTIAAGTSTGTALVSTGNTDGTLQLQVNGTTPSVTLAANGSVGVGSSPSYGNSGQVLTSSGTGSAPTWTTPSAGPVTLITSTTATAASSVVFTGLSTTYGMYLLEYDSVFGSAGDNLVLTISANNGSSYYSSSYAVQGTYTVNGSNSVYATTTDPFFILGQLPEVILHFQIHLLVLFGCITLRHQNNLLHKTYQLLVTVLGIWKILLLVMAALTAHLQLMQSKLFLLAQPQLLESFVCTVTQRYKENNYAHTQNC